MEMKHLGESNSATQKKAPKVHFNWHDDNTAPFLTIYISMSEKHGAKLSTNKLLELVAQTMNDMGYTVSAAQLKNRIGVLRALYIEIKTHNDQSGNDPYPDEPSFSKYCSQSRTSGSE